MITIMKISPPPLSASNEEWIILRYSGCVQGSTTCNCMPPNLPLKIPDPRLSEFFTEAQWIEKVMKANRLHAESFRRILNVSWGCGGYMCICWIL